MNVVDRVQLRLLLAELTHARVAEKDPCAEEAIRRMLDRQPDAAYLLVQRVLCLENALGAAGADEPTLRVVPAQGRAAARATRPDAPWWLQSAAAFSGVAFLARSAEYLLGPWY
jgi:hypothetical protein